MDKIEKIYKFITNPVNLKKAYDHVSTGKGATICRNSDNETLDEYSNEVVNKISKALKDHSFKFKPIRRVFIPKSDGTNRQLGIPSLRDKVVQQAAAMALEQVYEPVFLNVSHGFRPGKSCHTALHAISGWTGIKWFIEGDISKYFDTINQNILGNLLKKRIDDKEFIDFY